MTSFIYEGKEVRWVGTYTGSFAVIHQGRFYEQPFLEEVRALGLRGTYLDIGTNVGTHAVYFGLFCADRVIGFEPVPRFRARALQNIEANQLEGTVEVMPFGLAEASTSIPFDAAGPGTMLECRKLDDLLPDLTGVTFVKMDIEGNEPRALLGGREFFQRNRPVIAAEVLGSIDTLRDAAESIGYRLTGKVYPSAPESPMVELVPR
ncbi:FkbM family methyltransferase [Lysobacter sp. A6]|uniref:FkbM family methyltransferase n=1 Tax=Noviluteimonas lactosilytica TaxID=2888523 RepID=A0ABS8JJK2_9GAMM|nr:FkbM family methyltransferase [Lysobacter lactosilyticus]MCC8363781.1 FkbM family methyltransferase [Lysobacter lactosilyticus]